MADADYPKSGASEGEEIDTLQQTEVPFLNEMILTLIGSDGEVYVPVVFFAQKQLGVGNPYNQIARIKRDDTLFSGLRTMEMETSGGI